MRKQKIFIFCTIILTLLASSCDVVKKIVGFPDVDLGNIVNAKQSANGVEYDRNDFFQVCAFGSERQIRSLLKQNPAIINQTDGHGFTPIFYAVLGGNPQVIDTLFVNATTKDGIAPLIYAVNKNTSTDVARILMVAGDKKDAKYNGSYVYEYCNSSIKNTSVYTELRNAVKSTSWW